jgi:prepilin-type processing-associated H-X9-DG protein
LLELLAVVAIIAVLATLLSTALNQTKARAQQMSCLNNLRQLQVAWLLYAEDNEDYLPVNRSEPSANEALYGRRNTADSWVAGNPKEDISTENIKRGSLFRYVKNPGTYRCPADPGKVWVQKTARRTRSYSMSAYLGSDWENPQVKTRLSEIQAQRPAKIFVFIEEDMMSPWLGGFVVMPQVEKSVLASANFGGSLPGTWHNGGTDLSFADGHVEFWRWSSEKPNTASSSPSLLRYQLQDIRRLQEALPKP